MERLAVLETLAEQGPIHLTGTNVASAARVPYGWQFPGERVGILVQGGYQVNCWGLISRQSQWATTHAAINAHFVAGQVEGLSWRIGKETVVVLDFARIHTGKLLSERLAVWQRRGWFVGFLPPCSPRLNLAETRWRKLKAEWLRPEDYTGQECLFYAANRCLANVGSCLTIRFSPFNRNYFS